MVDDIEPLYINDIAFTPDGLLYGTTGQYYGNHELLFLNILGDTYEYTEFSIPGDDSFTVEGCRSIAYDSINNVMIRVGKDGFSLLNLTDDSETIVSASVTQSQAALIYGNNKVVYVKQDAGDDGLGRYYQMDLETMTETWHHDGRDHHALVFGPAPATCSELVLSDIPESVCDNETFILEASSITGGTIYWWDGMETYANGASISLPNGTYEFTPISDSEDDCAGEPIVITVYPSPDFTINSSDEDTLICEGDTIQLEVQYDGLDEITILWDEPIVDAEDVVFTDAGVYDIQVLVSIDETGCNETEFIALTVAEPLIIDSEISHEYLGADGAIDITISGGVLTYHIDWSNDGTGDFDDPEDLTSLTSGVYDLVVKDIAGCQTTDSFEIISFVQIKEQNKHGFSIYPNPIVNFIQISYEDVYYYEVFGLNGELILKGSASSATIIDCSELVGGVYFMKLQSETLNQTIKLVKK